jgi:hypothetical protein
MGNKRALWIAEGALFVIGVVALFYRLDKITELCVVAIAATMNNLADNSPVAK